MDTSSFLFFAFASLLLNITPGADMLYVATRSTSQGVKAGIVCALGIMAGCLIHLVAAVVGLSAVIAGSAIAFSVIRYAGAAYLIYLGLQSFFGKKNVFRLNKTATAVPLAKIFNQGIITNMLNPKVALFFLAFLPQFIHHGNVGIQTQILFLGLWFNISGTIVNIAVALLFGTMGNWLAGKYWFIQWQHKVTGLLLFGLGIRVALLSEK